MPGASHLLLVVQSSDTATGSEMVGFIAMTVIHRSMDTYMYSGIAKYTILEISLPACPLEKCWGLSNVD